MNIPLVEKSRHVDDDGIEVIEFETIYERMARESCTAYKQAVIDDLNRRFNELRMQCSGFQTPSPNFANSPMGQCCQCQHEPPSNEVTRFPTNQQARRDCDE